MEDVGDRRFGEWTLRCGDAQDELAEMDDNSVQTVITSPPYYGLRDYGDIDTVWGGSKDCDHTWGDSIPGSNRGGSGTPTDKNGRGEGYGRNANRGVYCQSCGAWKGQLGLEPHHDCGRPNGDLCQACYVCHIVAVFRRVRDVLRSDGTVWLNLGDSYSSGGRSRRDSDDKYKSARDMDVRPDPDGIKPKDLMGIPWRVALALQQDGWYLRQDVIWAKGISGQDIIQSDVASILRESGVDAETRQNVVERLNFHVGNVMPESVKDRLTSGHEHVFLLAPDDTYFYDHHAIKEKGSKTSHGGGQTHEERYGREAYNNPHSGSVKETGSRNRRDVWAINTTGYEDAHFAVMPPALVEPCIQAGTSAKGACPECGAPFERVVELKGLAGEETIQEGDRPAADERDVSESSLLRTNGRTWRKRVQKGWQATCDCDTDDEPVPCRVLDPFAGAGTTVLVANRLGREGVGIEIADKYVEMARERIQDDMRDRLSPWEDDYPEESEDDGSDDESVSFSSWASG